MKAFNEYHMYDTMKLKACLPEKPERFSSLLKPCIVIPPISHSLATGNTPPDGSRNTAVTQRVTGIWMGGERTQQPVEVEINTQRAFPIFTAYILRGSASVVFIGCLSFPTWPFHSRSDSCLSISIKSFIEKCISSWRRKKDTVWGRLLLQSYQHPHWVSGSRRPRCFSESISQIARNRPCLCKVFIFLRFQWSPYVTLSINCKLDQANSINV